MAEARDSAPALMSSQLPAVLASRDAFFRVMTKFVENECQDEGEDSISFLLAQIKQVVNLFHDMGLESLVGVYTAVTEHASTTFELHSGWKICSISGIPCRKTLYINDNTFVSTRYEKWVRCVWLAAHVHMLERSRRHERYSAKRIDAVEAEVYRLALKTVFESFLQAYATVRSDRFSRMFRRR
ncbi:MAG: hypothetical protein EBR09_16400 [Proteobacteria bacterium]|jgi:hypothetical protein|nr:hypothetical protein [Pseudomonadota bacterium]